MPKLSTLVVLFAAFMSYQAIRALVRFFIVITVILMIFNPPSRHLLSSSFQSLASWTNSLLINPTKTNKQLHFLSPSSQTKHKLNDQLPKF
jgi:hypothetical protein